MKKILLTCEHGGNDIPAAYKKLFRGHQAVLKTHRGLDIGALEIARELKTNLRAPLIFSTVSRLLVDLNRFSTSSTLMSEMTSHLPNKEKQKIIARYYAPHWRQVKALVAAKVARKDRVFHVAVHSMTDKLHGQTRPMQIALLYNPKRKAEKKLATLWIRELRKEFPLFKFARNNPYYGEGEGLTSALRKLHAEKFYVGMEIELNQAYLKTLKSPASKKQLALHLASSFQRALALFP